MSEHFVHSRQFLSLEEITKWLNSLVGQYVPDHQEDGDITEVLEFHFTQCGRAGEYAAIAQVETEN